MKKKSQALCSGKGIRSLHTGVEGNKAGRLEQCTSLSLSACWIGEVCLFGCTLSLGFMATPAACVCVCAFVYVCVSLCVCIFCMCIYACACVYVCVHVYVWSVYMHTQKSLILK